MSIKKVVVPTGQKNKLSQNIEIVAIGVKSRSARRVDYNVYCAVARLGRCSGEGKAGKEELGKDAHGWMVGTNTALIGAKMKWKNESRSRAKMPMPAPQDRE